MIFDVTYQYDGGGGGELVTATSADEATRLVMSRAQAKWKPGAICTHRTTNRLVTLAEVSSADIEIVYDCAWDRRDRGGAYLVVERGSRVVELETYYYRRRASCARPRPPRGRKALSVGRSGASALRRVASTSCGAPTSTAE